MASFVVPVGPQTGEVPLPTCVQVVLCGLSLGVRNALVGLVQTYEDQLIAYKALLEAKLVYLDLLTAPVKVANDLAQALIREVSAGANIVPLTLIGTCVEVGNLNAVIQTNLEIALHDANIVALDLERLLSFSEEVQAQINTLEVTIRYYASIRVLIQGCESTAFQTFIGATP